MVYMLITFLIGLMFVFVNVMFYVVVLLVFTLWVLLWLVSSGYIRTLIMLLVVIVYVGAIMILIGYICAVCPNPKLTPAKLSLFWLFFFTILLNMIFILFEINSYSKSSFILDYFFRMWGLLMFFVLVFILFFTLLIVTSQYNIPQGPFRSVF